MHQQTAQLAEQPEKRRRGRPPSAATIARRHAAANNGPSGQPGQPGEPITGGNVRGSGTGANTAVQRHRNRLNRGVRASRSGATMGGPPPGTTDLSQCYAGMSQVVISLWNKSETAAANRQRIIGHVSNFLSGVA